MQVPAEKKKNARLIRLLVPALVLGIAVGFVYMVFTSAPTSQRAADTQRQTQLSQQDAEPQATQPTDQLAADTQQPASDQPTPTDTQQNPDPTQEQEDSNQPDTQDNQQDQQEATPADTDSPNTDSSSTTPESSDAILTGLRARDWGPLEEGSTPTPLGSIDPETSYRLLVEPSYFGGGLMRATASNYHYTIEDDVKAAANPAEASGHYVIQEGANGRTSTNSDGVEITPRLRPYAMVSMTVQADGADPVSIRMFGGSYGRVWRETAPGVLQAEIINDNNETVLRIRRKLELLPDSYELAVTQTIDNLTDTQLRIVLEQDGPVNLVMDTSGYRIPLRRVRFGYYLPQPMDPSRAIIRADKELLRHENIIKRWEKAVTEQTGPVPALWPAEALENADSLAWFAQSNRYFTSAMHTPEPQGGLPGGAQGNPGAIPSLQSVRGEVLVDPNTPDEDMRQRVVMRSLSGPIEIPPNAQADASFGAFIGPMNERYLRDDAQPIIRAINLAEIVIYNLGGPCAFCTFQWLADPLLAILRFFEGIFGDWAIAIILLVVCVRGCLHPLTRKGQISMMKTGKGMQRIKPKMDKLREKFGKDPKRMQQEMLKLYREEGVNPAGMLGCLPMMLQSPIWIALYAMLYMSFDLRHEGAFYGLFQTVTAGNWTFMADLARGDGFISFGQTLFTVPLLGNIDSINILPLLLGVVFFLQQKYLTMQNTSMMTPEQQAQQRIVRVIMVVMFPIFMYNAPAALTLYFITNSSLGILESRWIRAHVDTLELDKAPSERSEHALRGGGRKRVQNQAQSPFGAPKGKTRDEHATKRYKKRK